MTFRLGNFIVSGASPEQERVLKAREQVVLAFAASKGKKPEDLTMDEILEVRAKLEWKTP